MPTILRAAFLVFATVASVNAQVIGVGYQVAESDQKDMHEATGPGLRLRLRAPIDLRYDYLVSEGRRFDSVCGGFIPPGCDPETIEYASSLHNIFVAARLILLTRGSFGLIGLPEVGFVMGKISKTSVATGLEGASSTGGSLGLGGALELSAAQLGGTPIGGWIAARFRGFSVPGEAAADAYEPHRELNWIRSAEIGITFVF